jgi:hypothetical protein
MKNISPQAELSALERRIAAIHEAGHVVVGHHLGCELVGCHITARIIRNENAHLFERERTWWGCANFSAVNRLDSLQRRTIACAGFAAERCWRGDNLDPDLWKNPSVMSQMDWAMAECEPGKADRLCVIAINRLGPLLSMGGPLWDDLLRQARQLIIDSRRCDA